MTSRRERAVPDRERRRLLRLALAGATLAGLHRSVAAERSATRPAFAPERVPDLSAGRDLGPGSAVGSGSDLTSGSDPDEAADAAPRWLAGARFGEDEFRAVTLDAFGQARESRALPSRAHGAAVHVGRGVGCVFARRPGTWLCTFELGDIGAARFVDPAPGRRFSGHGVYSRDGALLYTSESDIDRQRGVVGIRDATAGYRRVGELATHGIGPHEILRPPGTDLLVVANGGIATHPDEGDGRTPLNLATMAPSIVVLDARDGALLSRHALPPAQHRVSLRHLAVDADHRVWFAAQYAHDEGNDWRSDAAAPPLPLAGSFALAGRHGRLPAAGKVHSLDVLELPRDQVSQEHAYLSSVATDARHVVWTSSREGLALRVDARRGTLDGVVRVADCSGVAPAPDGDGFLLSTGFGETLRWRTAAPVPLASAPCAWDNHLTTVA